MKKILRGIMALMLCASFAPANAQQIPELPADTAVIKGVLPNGLTYYIRHNDTPKGQADFHIAQKVGSVLEEDHQRGLAHFLEHMCFNGTKNFPGNSLISYLESIGVKFGSNLNAYTSTDETVYKITNVPTARTEVTDSVLLILHDWANELLLEPAEIDKERGVIHEEYRQSNVGTMRILSQLMPTIYPDSKYAYRLPIGTLEVIDNFPYQALRDYYEAWYRPDQQGIVVCGDIDPVRTEQVIKEMFSDIEMPENAPERVYFPVPDTPGTIYAIGADKEQTNAMTYLMFKHEVMPMELRNTQMYLIFNYLESMISSMLNARFQEMMSKPETPFAVAQCMMDQYMMSSTEDMFAVIGVAKDGNIANTLQSIYREVLRAKRGGFTQTEYDRARSEYLASLEKTYNNRNSLENYAYTNDMIRNFIDGTPMLSVELEYQIMSQMAQMVDLNSINATFSQMVTDDNRVVLCMLPEAAIIPTEAELASVMSGVDAEEIEVFTDNVRTDPLIPQLPASGAITAAEPFNEFEGTTVWTLSNGAKVYVKKTDFKQDEIIFYASAPGGLSEVYTTSTPSNGIAIELFAGSYGIGAYSNADLQKYLTGKKASISPSFSLYETAMSGSSTPKDLPTLMELIYGYFTSVNYPEDEFEATRSLYHGIIQNQEVSPEFVFQKELTKSLFKSPYLQTLTAADLEACTREGIEALVRSRLNDASQWSFVFVGNFNEAQLRTLCEQYVASLPSTNSKVKRILKANSDYQIAKGSGVSTSTTAMETPQTWCAIVESATMDFNSRNAKMASIAGQILSARLLKTIREEMGAVYSIGAQGDLDAQKGLNASIITAFPMNPEMKEKVLESIKAEFTAMAEEITPEELNKVKEYMVKNYAERMEQNGPWASYLNRWTLTGQNMISNAQEEVNSITPADIQKFMKDMNKQGNYRVVILDPQP